MKIVPLILALLLFSFYAHANDKVEFKRLYAEFNDLYTNSEEIDPIIEVAEKLYKLAPKAYGKNHANTAVVTYNLASLYDEKGGQSINDNERRAVALYEEYFENLNKRQIPKDKTYLDQYLNYVTAERNSKGSRSSSKPSKTALKIAKEINIPLEEYADMELFFGELRAKSFKRSDARKFYESALKNYRSALGDSHFKVGKTYFWLAQAHKAEKRNKRATENYELAISVLENDTTEDGMAMVLLSHRNLATMYAEDEDHNNATRHIMLFAVKKPDDNSEDIIDVYRPDPDFSKASRKAAKEGNNRVELTFDIDEEGFTRNIRVYSDNDKALINDVVDAVSRHRYVPLVIDGKFYGRKDYNYSFTYTVRDGR